MSLQKAGGTNIDNTVVPAAATNLVDHLETYLVSAGWSIISGTGTDAIKFESATTPEGMKIRILTGVSGSDMSLELRNAGETATGTAGCIRLTVDGSSTWRFMANKYGFVLFQDTTPVAYNASGAKKWCICSTLHLDTFLTAGVTEVGFLMGDHYATGTNTHRRSFRTDIAIGGNPAVFQGLYNGTLMEIHSAADGGVQQGNPALLYLSHMPPASSSFAGSPDNDIQYATGEFPICDPLVMWGTPDRTTNMGRIRGQIYDVLIAQDASLARNDIITIGLDTFRVVNDPGAGGSTAAQDHGFAILWLQP